MACIGCCCSMNAHCPVDEARFVLRRAEIWLGTLVEIRASSISRCAVQDGLRNAFAMIARIHHALSGHDPVSELARVNLSAATKTQPISAHFRTVLRCALD